MAGKRKDRFAQLRTSGPGYETTGKEQFDSMVEFTFDYSDLDRASRQVKKDLADFNYELKQSFKRLGGKPKDGYIGFSEAKFASAGVGRNPAEKFALLPDGVQMTLALKDGMQDMGREGVQVMRKYVNRIETGRMKDSITYNTRSYSNKYVVRIGWTQLWYKYFGFQENGTQTGIRPMHSIIRTYMEMLPRVGNYMSRFTRSYTRGTGDQYAGKGVKF